MIGWTEIVERASVAQIPPRAELMARLGPVSGRIERQVRRLGFRELFDTVDAVVVAVRGWTGRMVERPEIFTVIAALDDGEKVDPQIVGWIVDALTCELTGDELVERAASVAESARVVGEVDAAADEVEQVGDVVVGGWADVAARTPEQRAAVERLEAARARHREWEAGGRSAA